MKYYILSRESDPEIVGVPHGGGQFFIDSKFDKEHPWFDEIFFNKPKQTKDWWKFWARMPTYGNKLVGLTMEKKSKHTDLVDTGGFMRGFIVNKNLREILEQAHLPNHKFFEAVFIQNGNIIKNYWWFVFDMETGEHTVNFTKSEFDLMKHEQKFGKNFKIQSYTDYMNIFYETGEAVKATKLVFNKNFDKGLDIFGTQFLSTQKAYISERLLHILQEAKITGYVAISIEEAKKRAKLFINEPCELLFE